MTSPAPALIVIPARRTSRRLPEKPLLDLHGRTMIQRVAEAMREVPGAVVVVVTDDARVARSAAEVGVETFVSTRRAESGSDRIRHFLDDSGRAWPELLVNVQGDEPLLEGEVVAALLRRMRDDPLVRVATPLRGLRGVAEVSDPNVVKASLLPGGRIEDFTRLPLEEATPAGGPDDLACARRHRWLVHVGVYAFRGEAFRAFTDLPPSPRERAEHLEQLRMLENDIPVHGVTVCTRSLAVDTPRDADRVRAALLAEGAAGEGPSAPGSGPPPAADSVFAPQGDAR
ncbi:MAG: 3-deoxy-manno-octulosonate cytidylyltransferase [Gemmatimonadetes bacterium]|nr:3-deoxy-manno-octulosonate cytidylyltransferase [Gemmatimonadota bacterium]